ncbi:MAG TPA: hypothetical protein VM580_16505 [Labilithrix sp.]|nr:hypothetical protein [Labilithrix sp.]
MNASLVDPCRGASVVARTPLLYRRGADATLDRPPHVRAGSALAELPGGSLAVIQDDACFLAIIDAASGAVIDVPFPGGAPRQFDDLRGNKKKKLDLEAVFVARGASGTSGESGGVLVALGSGSSPLRERVVMVEDPAGVAPRVAIVDAHELYARLRADRSFSGAELNIEGAAIVGEDVVLFQRGNGAPLAYAGGDIEAIDATARLALAPLLAYLRKEGPLPVVREVRSWNLGAVEGHRLSFTDGAVHPNGRLGFLACAEDCPDATRDGPVLAVMLGCLEESAGVCALGVVLDERGAPLLDKAEGLVFDASNPTRAFVVTDCDTPDAPSELLELRLGDAWAR